MVKKGKCLYLKEDLCTGIHACGIENLSEFVNFVMEETILLDNPDYSPRKQAKIIADKVRKNLLAQRKIVEEEQTYQEQAEAMHERFLNEASHMFRNIKSFSSRLPEYDVHGDNNALWDKCADSLSEVCGFLVTPSECITFVRKMAEAEEGV